MSFGNDRIAAENKIILLYLLEKISKPMSNLQVTKFILDQKLMNYFALQQMLEELLKSGFVILDSSQGYSITPEGKTTLDYLINLLPFGIKSVIDDQVIHTRKQMKRETQVKADFTPVSEKEFVVSLKVGEEDFSLIDLKVAVGRKQDARSICENWEAHTTAIYSEILESLTKKRE